MKRVCIFPIFDKDGIFDESVLFFIRSLKEVVERLIIVVIGFITNDSLLFLKKYTNEILISLMTLTLVRLFLLRKFLPTWSKKTVIFGG